MKLMVRIIWVLFDLILWDTAVSRVLSSYYFSWRTNIWKSIFYVRQWKIKRMCPHKNCILSYLTGEQCKSTCSAFKLVQSNLKCSLRTLTSEGDLNINIYQINIYQVLHKASNFVIKEKNSIGVWKEVHFPVVECFPLPFYWLCHHSTWLCKCFRPTGPFPRHLLPRLCSTQCVLPNLSW